MPTAGIDSKKILIPHWVAFSNQYLSDITPSYVRENNTNTIAIDPTNMEKIYQLIEKNTPVIVY